jgi:hypothetical protein
VIDYIGWTLIRREIMTRAGKKWDMPEIPQWMESVNDHSALTFREIAQIFKIPPGKAFKKSFILRFDRIEITTPSASLCVKKEGFYKNAQRIKMGEIRALVSRIQNEQ